jgi:hypothetical protein
VIVCCIFRSIPDGIAFPPNEYQDFFQDSALVTAFLQLIEFSRARNPIDVGWQSEFLRIFAPDSLRTLDISQCFKQGDLWLLMEILKHFALSQLWGLAIRGTYEKSEFCYGDDLRHLFLSHLDISNQFFTSVILSPLRNFIQTSHALVELSVEGTELWKSNDFYAFYTDILHAKSSLRVTQRPYIDITRIKTGCAKFTTLKGFRDLSVPFLCPSTRRVRAAYYERCLDRGIEILDFLKCFPISAQSLAPPHKLRLSKMVPGTSQLQTLHNPACNHR